MVCNIEKLNMEQLSTNTGPVAQRTQWCAPLVSTTLIIVLVIFSSLYFFFLETKSRTKHFFLNSPNVV